MSLPSARVRVPTGATNINSSRQDTSIRTVTPKQDGTVQKRDFRDSQRAKSRGPFSPRYIEPAVPPPEIEYRANRHCPKDWIEYNQNPPFTENRIELQKLDGQEKAELVDQFINRNENCMWRYDPTYKGKSRDEIRTIISDKSDFAIKMANYSKMERRFKLSTSSENLKSCLAQKLSENQKELHPDPYISTMTTSRTAREERQRLLFAPATSGHVNRHPRGEEHAIEWGNFSRFVGHLKKNEMAMLKR